MEKNLLGQVDSYKKNDTEFYNPELLFAISRSENRKNLALGSVLPFSGFDRWNAYEFSYLNNNGLPKVTQLTIDIPCETECIVESKSLKLYLNSFSFKRFLNESEVLKLISADLKALLKVEITIHLHSLDSLAAKGFENLTSYGECLDNLDLKGEIDFDTVNANLLSVHEELPEDSSEHILFSHLFRSLCPVTGQPDWATIVVSYQGKIISKESLLRYLLSFRKHQGFHEDCVERIYCDVNKMCSPKCLSVYAAFTRRGGIDINPFRSNYQTNKFWGRLARQ